jgi:exo-beta-1,3-glucanase (GH17 family)
VVVWVSFGKNEMEVILISLAPIDVDSNTDAYTSQVEAVEDALKTYGTDHVLGVTVGNEYILK